MKLVLPGWTGRVAAIALLLGVGLAVYGLLIGPLIAAYEKVDREIVEANELQFMYQRIAHSRGRLQAEFERLTALQASSGIYLTGDTDALAAAALQEIVNATVESAGGRLRSVQILPAKAEGLFKRIGVRVQMSASIAELAQALYAFEAGETFLFVDNLEVSNSRARRKRKDPTPVEPSLKIRLDISGYRKPEVG